MPNTPSAGSVNLFSFLFGNQNALLGISIAAVGAFVAILTYRHTRRSSIGLRRLEMVISPLFELIEPTMYKDAKSPEPQTITSTLRIIDNNPMLAGGRLRECSILLHDNGYSNAAWSRLCSQTSREYDRLCRWYLVPKRSMRYRVRYYKPRFSSFYLAVMLLRALLSLAFGIVAILLSFSLIHFVLLSQFEMIIPVCITLFIAILAFSLLTI